MTERGTPRAEAGGRSRWAQLARRADQPAAAVPELRPVPVRPPDPAAGEHHLGDRLTAYLDGELGHDSRERVQSHLATCADCLAEAEAARAVKKALTRTDTPAPSSLLMARLLAVAALPDDLDGPGGPGAPAGPVAPDAQEAPPFGGGTFGGSRLTGGSFGRGAGSTFGGGALGAESPIPGIDPRAQRATAPRGRRLVFAAAGAFSVAAVTLGGVGGVSASSTENQRSTTVTPIGGAVTPVTAQLPIDYRDYPARSGRMPDSAVDQHYPR